MMELLEVLKWGVRILVIIVGAGLVYHGCCDIIDDRRRRVEQREAERKGDFS